MDYTKVNFHINNSFSGLPQDTAAHKGMAMGAAKMLRRLLPVLDRTFQQFPHYDLILTGKNDIL